MKEPFFTIDERIETLCRQAEEQCAGIFRQIDDTADYNARKVLAAFIKNRVSEPMFAGTTGYGYGDIGREALDAVLADTPSSLATSWIVIVLSLPELLFISFTPFSAQFIFFTSSRYRS